MSKKYELVNFNPEPGLWQIRALRDFDFVKAGDLGGWVKGGHNLSHEGNCWVGEHSKIFDDSYIWDNAKIQEHSIVTDRATIRGQAIVRNATIRDKVEVSDFAIIHDATLVDFVRVFDKANIRGPVMISGKTIVCGYANVRKSNHEETVQTYCPGGNPVDDTITIDGAYVNFGDICETVDYWNREGRSFLEKEGYDKGFIERFMVCVNVNNIVISTKEGKFND